MVSVLLGIGSNINKEENVTKVLKILDSDERLTLLCHSRIYETIALGKDGSAARQSNFYNLAARLETELDAKALIALLRAVEERLGRIRSADKYAPRPIDLDILFYGPNSFDIDGYQFPDPTISKFPHLACPLAEIAPDWIFPALHHEVDGHAPQTLRMLADQLLNETETANQIVRIIEL